MPQNSAPETVDIEALLDLAYRQKQIHRLGGERAAQAALGMTGGPRAPGSAFSTSDKVDTSSYAARMAAEARGLYLRLANAPDALLTVHDAVLALPDFYVELGPEGSWLVWDRATAASMGHRINPDRDAPTIVAVGPRRVLRTSEAQLGGDAVEAAEVGPRRALVPIVTATLLVIEAVDATRPYVSPIEVARLRPIYRGGDKCAVGHEPEYVTPLDVVAVERATYAVWHRALALLVGALSGLPGYAVVGPAPPAEPWARAGRVLLGRPQVTLVEDLTAPKAPRKRAKTASEGSKVVSSKALKLKGKEPVTGGKKRAL